MLGIGGAAAYIWKQTFSDLSSNHDQLSSNNFFHWLFSEERLRGEGFQGGKRDGARETCCSDLPVGGDRSHSCLGLNILTGDNQNRKEHFLKQRLFDVRSSDTSRFMPDRRKMVRGSPDGGEDSQLADPERLVSRNRGYRRCSVSSGMEKIMKKAKDVRKLIREASFDSLASEFLLDIEFDTVSLDDASVTEDVTVTSDTEEYVLDRNIFNRFKSNEAWRLVNSTRESSLFSEKGKTKSVFSPTIINHFVFQSFLWTTNNFTQYLDMDTHPRTWALLAMPGSGMTNISWRTSPHVLSRS